jgi:putative transposase
MIYHVLNRGNGRQRLFRKPGDYDAFVELLRRVHERRPVSILGYCLMPNHWHLVLGPKHDGDLSSFMLRLQTAHVRRHFAHHPQEPGGHLYQGRFKSFPVKDDLHLLTLLRYVESNALRARLVRDADNWQWSSHAARRTPEGRALLAEWPIDRPRDWSRLLAESLPEPQIDSIRRSIHRGRPYGDEAWVQRTAKRLGLDFTLRPVGRPRKSLDTKN